MAVLVYSLCLIICPFICFLQRSDSLAANEIKDRHLGHRRDVFSPLSLFLSSLSFIITPRSSSHLTISLLSPTQWHSQGFSIYPSFSSTYLSQCCTLSFSSIFHGLYKTDCVKRHRKVRDVLLCEGVTLWFIDSVR